MATTHTTPTYKIIRIPRASPRLAELVARSRTARLHALETDPSSFLSQHATESALPLDVWQKRLCHADVVVMICVAIYPAAAADSPSCLTAPSNADDESVLLGAEWVGFAAVRGPMDVQDYYVSPDMGLPVPHRPDEERRWHVFDLYTLSAHRGRGLARSLVGECVDVAVEGTQELASSPLLACSDGAVRVSEVEVKQARIRLFVDPKNAWLVRMYEGLGFRAAGKVTLEEGFRANRLDESIPGDTRLDEELERLWHTRFGLAMEQVVAV